jgi:hypothetical protein
MRKFDKLALSNNEWLATLPEPARSELIIVAKIRHDGEKERVHSKGGVSDGLCGLLSGEVRVSASSFPAEHQ